MTPQAFCPIGMSLSPITRATVVVFSELRFAVHHSDPFFSLALLFYPKTKRQKGDTMTVIFFCNLFVPLEAEEKSMRREVMGIPGG